MIRWWLCACGVLAFASVAGCKSFDKSLLPPQSAVSCPNGTKAPPGPPSASNGQAMGEMVFALKDVTLNQSSVGFNLDGICTGSSGPYGCLPPDSKAAFDDGGMPSVPVADSTKGVDSQFATQLYSHLGIFGLDALQSQAQMAEAQGDGAPVVVLDDYNGTANDPQVKAVIATSVFAAEGTGGVGGTEPAVCPPTTPGGVAYYADTISAGNPDGCSPPTTQQVAAISAGAWTSGNLWFWVRDDEFTNMDINVPKIVDPNAYVTNYQLVVTLPDPSILRLTAGSLSIDVNLHDGVAVGTLDPTLTGTTMNGVTIAGRWASQDILDALGAIGICTGSSAYNTIHGYLNQFADMRAQKGTEGSDVACDAISIGITMTAYRANLGGLATGSMIVNQCP